MTLIYYTTNGLKQIISLDGVFKNATAMLVGGSPSLKEQPIELLNQRGILTMAINNAAIHFRPVMWVSGDNPACYEPQILHDPGIMKFAPDRHSNVETNGKLYKNYNNIYFYTIQTGIPFDELLNYRNTVPWYNNTLFVAIYILYHLGIRRIILAGSDFSISPSGNVYAHPTKNLGSLEKKWNLDLYNSLVRDLRMLKPMFDRNNLQLLDCSKNSRLAQTYEHITFEKAIELCLEGFPKTMKDPSELPHCSKFAPPEHIKKIAEWPGYNVIK